MYFQNIDNGLPGGQVGGEQDEAGHGEVWCGRDVGGDVNGPEGEVEVAGPRAGAVYTEA